MSLSQYIGTSGWYYKHWDIAFYPEGLKSDQRLEYYSKHFKTVEINSTFYHLPKETAVKNWFIKVPDDFVFSVKASRYITHQKKLHDCKESLDLFFKQVSHLRNKLGPILFQLPPMFKKNLERLELFIKDLEDSHAYVFEFRNPTWFDDQVYELLKRNNIAFCISDIGGVLNPVEVTADFAYIRLHGPQNSYSGSYTTKELNSWEKRILDFQNQDIKVFCYFDNDEKGYAVKDAKRLIHLIEK